MLKIDKPICFFDVETTGLNVATDRIVSIAILKLMPDGEILKKKRLINPTVPIPAETTEIHGITDEMVKDEPPFKTIAKSLYDYMYDSDIAGYNNNHYDNPLLAEEFARCDIEFPTAENRSIDVGNIFKINEKRTLEAAMVFYCGKEMTDAHDAEADVEATYEVFKAQLERYEELKGKDMEFVSDFSKMDNRVDFAGKIVLNEDGVACFNFGKAKGTPVKEDIGFAEWMLDKDFTLNTKLAVKRALEDANFTVNIEITPNL